jgi:hypothetical protein
MDNAAYFLIDPVDHRSMDGHFSCLETLLFIGEGIPC